ncbi:hypothetical protein K435DRAFT_858101 [Dendrothele bispora CBS 962.96]|uniref:Uncharacterized protein n=1 Tax=Dendrothele bispora (strain CBS 962.96) TaxID=1314807 RepID=A0A4S8M461_DENBC|nr:hypothetical protein K435DRAFT_858101 [Dendrothele bispora CBS 962.96]
MTSVSYSSVSYSSMEPTFIPIPEGLQPLVRSMQEQCVTAGRTRSRTEDRKTHCLALAVKSPQTHKQILDFIRQCLHLFPHELTTQDLSDSLAFFVDYLLAIDFGDSNNPLNFDKEALDFQSKAIIKAIDSSNYYNVVEEIGNGVHAFKSEHTTHTTDSEDPDLEDSDLEPEGFEFTDPEDNPASTSQVIDFLFGSPLSDVSMESAQSLSSMSISEEDVPDSVYMKFYEWKLRLEKIFLNFNPGPVSSRTSFDDLFMIEETERQKQDNSGLHMKRRRALNSLVKEMKEKGNQLLKEEGGFRKLKNSGLGKVINKITSPVYCSDYASEPHTLFRAILIREHALRYTLGNLLESWIPEEMKKEWDVSEDSSPTFTNSPSQQQRSIKEDAEGFLKLIDDEKLLLLDLQPQVSIYFLLSQDTFEKFWYSWLAPNLAHKGYNVSVVSNETLYRIFSFIGEWIVKHNSIDDLTQNMKFSLVLAKIINRSASWRKLKKDLQRELFGTDPKSETRARHRKEKKEMVLPYGNAPKQRGNTCPHCKDKEQKDWCTEIIIVEEKSIEQLEQMCGGQVVGCGITMVPESERMTPLSQEKQGRKKTPLASCPSPAPPMYHADTFKLKRVCPNPEKIARCNQHIFLLKKNEQDDEVLDFVKYKAWTPDRLNILCEHNSRASATTSFHRGQKVTGWGEGSMTGWGARLPAGGAPGDGYDIYKGMAISDQGSVEEGIDLFHDHAEDALVLEETARVIYPSLVRKLKDDTTDCGRVGRYGATMYRAVNYIAGIHSEGDAGHGLCCQLEWFGKKEWDEFAFVYLAYGVYFVTEANMLWSFDANKLHGTMLPGRETIQVARLRGGKGCGAHKSSRRKDINRAKKHVQVEKRQGLREAAMD